MLYPPQEPVYGPQQYPQPAPYGVQPPKSKKKFLIIAVIVVVVVIIVAGTLVVFFGKHPLVGKWKLDYMEDRDGKKSYYDEELIFESNGNFTMVYYQWVVEGKWKDIGGGKIEITTNGKTQEMKYSINCDRLTLEWDVFKYYYTRVY